uniref:ATPase subunit 6 n=1 Tax=Taenia solium TaxID=6204 RepID=Q9TGK2_TAESO|nr:ATP synthase F0 subunit 6 [Taenia solium]BAA83532.1 ATPase subunit 6 [Taenia solium]BAC00838.1 ATPase subunit 6 [Taenia solium]
MFNNVNDLSSLMIFINKFVLGDVKYYYFNILGWILFLFLCYRFPYCYSPYMFSTILISVVFSCFVSLFLGRICDNVNIFFSSLIPVGTPIYICPLVCVAESISYIIRPVVLILRPFINISLGCFGVVALGNLSLISAEWCIVIFFLFFYEVFVALVHWFIVTSILAFSIDH